MKYKVGDKVKAWIFDDEYLGTITKVREYSYYLYVLDNGFAVTESKDVGRAFYIIGLAEGEVDEEAESNNSQDDSKSYRIKNPFSYPLYYGGVDDDNIHESIYRSYHILDLVLKMIERGNSKETILELADFYKNYEEYKPAEIKLDINKIIERDSQ